MKIGKRNVYLNNLVFMKDQNNQEEEGEKHSWKQTLLISSQKSSRIRYILELVHELILLQAWEET
jgi:hypothetical protein